MRRFVDFGNPLSDKRGKYGNRKVVIQGIKFDSSKEGQRWLFLKDCEKRGLISDLRMQVVFVLLPDEYEEYVVHIKTKEKAMRRRTFIGTRYEADFVYVKDGVRVVEDVKGSKKLVADDAALKIKMMHSLLGIDVRIVTSATEPV